MKPGMTPELTDIQTIHALAEYEERDTVSPSIVTRHRDLMARIQLDPDIVIRELTAALAYSGFTLRHNPETGDLWLTKVTR